MNSMQRGILIVAAATLLMLAYGTFAGGLAGPRWMAIIEFFLGLSCLFLAARPRRETKLSEPIQAENTKLRVLVEHQEGRIRSLERIATDPAERTARDIEALRDAYPEP